MEPIIQRWYDMIRINSVNGHEAPMADYIAAALEGMGLTPHWSYFPEDAEAKERLSLDGAGQRSPRQDGDAHRPHRHC